LATPVDKVVEFTKFTGPTSVKINDVFSWDIVSSDSQKDAGGVASFTVVWSPE
jgi:hypothetical protein